ncbi:MAG: pantetheine-phosphate adenylyltransferase [Deltaproteobacteria bacterium]|jgi:pantetheine-phosphate adenylyltransferase|nr:pantetheine-phosphate adenylyltransferase [Deltaproteobacteria bacterium]
MEQERTAIYPGTFDPLTNGHVSLISRAKEIFDQIVVAVAAETPKHPLFTLEERVQLAREALEDSGPGIVVEPFDGLLVDYVAQRGSRILLRGLRAVSDFEYEFQLALMNRKLRREIQTVFLMTDYQWLYISSTIIKAAASLGGDIHGLVPACVERSLQKKYAKGDVRRATPCLVPSTEGFALPGKKHA